MKREQSDEGGEKTAGNKRNRRNDDIVRLLIPSRIAGAVIGKGGQHIQKMRSQFKATVSVDDCQGPERTILISSDLESVLSIIKEMLKYFEEKDNEVDVRMLIHQSLAGCVIGKGGAKIKEIRDKIGCRILKVFSNVAPQSTDRIVQVIGKQEQCVEAVREVLDVTRDTPIKGSVHNYDPINFDDLYADEYGGYGGMQNGGGGGMGGGMRGGDRQSRFDRRGDNPRRFGGNQGDRNRRDDRSRSGGRRDREYINPWANDGPISSGMGNMGGTSFGGNMGGGFSGSGGFGGNSGNGFNSGTGGGFNSGSGSGFGGSSGGGFGSANTGFGGSGSFGSGPAGNFVGTGGFGGGSAMPGGGSLGNGIGGTGLGGGSVGTGNMNNSSGGGFNSGMNNGGPVNVDDKNSTQVTIPKDLAGAIIGKGGGRIRRIRNESGAYITIDEPLPGSNDRIITISGNPKQIQMAQYLLQQSVHENRRKF